MAARYAGSVDMPAGCAPCVSAPGLGPGGRGSRRRGASLYPFLPGASLSLYRSLPRCIALSLAVSLSLALYRSVDDLANTEAVAVEPEEAVRRGPPQVGARERKVHAPRRCPRPARKVDVRLPGKVNPNSHGARPVHLITTIRG